jgi:hypothetical protein
MERRRAWAEVFRRGCVMRCDECWRCWQTMLGCVREYGRAEGDTDKVGTGRCSAEGEGRVA